MAKYLIVFKDWRSNVPQSLRDGVRKQIEDELGQFDVELDFTGTQRERDLVVTLTRDLPIWSVFGESVRPSMNNEIQSGEFDHIHRLHEDDAHADRQRVVRGCLHRAG